MKKHTSLIFLFLLALTSASCSQLRQPGTSQVGDSVPPLVDMTIAVTNTPVPVQTPTLDILQGTITIWHSWDEPNRLALDQIIDDFQVLYPNVYFDVLYIPMEHLLDRFITEVQTGGGPSILLGPAEWGPVLYDDQLISDLSERADNPLLETLNPAALEQMSYHNAIIGLPYRIQGVVLYRNRSIIPEIPESFDDLVSLSQTTTQGDIIGAILERGFYFSGGHLSGIGGKLMDQNGDPAFNNQKGIDWVDMLLNFELAGPTEYLSDRDLDFFSEGRVGFIIDGTWNMELLSEAIGSDNLAIDPWPSYEDGYLSGYVQGEDAYISSRVDEHNIGATWLFMEYLVSPEAQLLLAEVGYIPAIRGIQLVGGSTYRHLTQVMNALEGGAGYPVLPEMEAYIAPMDIALQSVFYNNVSPSEALQNAEDAILNSLEQYRATPTALP